MTDTYQEASARIRVGDAFFRPQARPARDLGVLAAQVYRQRQGHLRVLDVMSATGIRSIRYWHEAGASFVWANDANSDLQAQLHQNLASNGLKHQVRVTALAANRLFAHCLMEGDDFDLVDVDTYGTGAAQFAACLQAVGSQGLLYYTTTDGRGTTGHDWALGLRAYGAIARSHPSAQEQGLRLVIASLLKAAWQQGFGLRPLFSYFQGQTFRVMVQRTRSLNPASDLGFLGYCHACGHYQCVQPQRLGRSPCAACGQPLSLSGPLWLGPLHDRNWLVAMQQSAIERGWRAIAQCLSLFQGEVDLPPWLFPLGELGRRGKLDPPPRDLLIAALKQQGFCAAPTHLKADALKTDASLAICVKAAQAIQTNSPIAR